MSYICTWIFDDIVRRLDDSPCSHIDTLSKKANNSKENSATEYERTVKNLEVSHIVEAVYRYIYEMMLMMKVCISKHARTYVDQHSP